MQLVRFLTGRFALNHSPTREGGEVMFAKDEKRKKHPEHGEQLPGESPSTTPGIHSQRTVEKVGEHVPEIYPDLEAVYRSPDVVLVADSDELAEATSETKGGPQEATTDAKQRHERLTRVLLNKPKTILNVIASLQEKIRRIEELKHIVATKQKQLYESAPSEQVELVKFFNVQGDDFGETSSQIEALPNEEFARTIQVARGAEHKLLNLLEHAGDTQEQRNAFHASLRQQVEALKRHLHRQLQGRADRLQEKFQHELERVPAGNGEEKSRRAYLLDSISSMRILLEEIAAAAPTEQEFMDRTGLWIDLLSETEQELQFYREDRCDFSKVSEQMQEHQEWLITTNNRVQKLLDGQEWNDEDREFLHRIQKRCARESGGPRIFSPGERDRIDTVLATLQHAGKGILERARREEQHAVGSTEAIDAAWCGATQGKIEELRGPLLHMLGSDKSRAPKITAAVQKKIDELRERVTVLSDVVRDNKVDPNGEALRRERASIDVEFSKLEQCYEELRKIQEAGVQGIDDADAYKKACDDAAGTSIACYQPRDRRMYANGTLLREFGPGERAKKLEQIAHHEFHHAIKDIVQTTVFPNLLFDEFTWLFPEDTGTPDPERDEFEQLLLQVEKEWNIAARWESSGMLEALGGKDSSQAKRERFRMVMDELGEEYRAWQSGTSPKSDAEKRLHELYAKKRGEVPYRKLALHMTADEHPLADGQENLEGQQQAHADTPQAQEQSEESPEAQIKKMKKMVQEIEQFGRDHPEFASDVSAVLDGDGGLHQSQAHLEYMVRHHQTSEGVALTPQELAAEVAREMKRVGDIHERMEAERNAVLDPTYAQPVVPQTFWSRMHFLSISDVIKICKEIKEDWLAESTRAQERKTSEVEEMLTSMIPDDLPFPWGKYTSRLKHYARRRKTQTEQAASKKWEDDLTLRDPHDLLDMLALRPTRDQLKALINLLCHKGHMDWNSPKLWKALEEHSGYKMPKEALTDDVLRDKWLRKIITAIWTDEKEFYDHAKVENDNAYESGMNKYAPQAEDYSNIKGEMASQLHNMLGIWVNSHGHPPVEVSPHKYEKIIHYAMTNGKMTMEQKFFYLIQGAATGLIPVQRVRMLAGEKAGILNKFPFIDYFSGNDNTLPKLQALAKRLTEKDAYGKPTLQPGNKTTMWLHRVVARDPAVRTRVMKGADRIAEQMDHEDIPFFITALGVNGVSILAGVISGHRQKVTTPGWKNAYCGFSSRFKIFGLIAKLERDRKPGAHLTQEDIRTLAQNLGGYIFMDNALTRSVCDNFGPTGRPKLTEADFDGLPAPSSSRGNTTRKYQKSLNSLVRDVLRGNIGNAIRQDPDWATKCTELQLDRNTAIDKFAPMDPADKWGRNSEKDSMNLAKANDAFMTALEKAIMNNIDEFKAALVNNADMLLNEGGSEDLNLENVEANLRAETEGSNGGEQDVGHGGGHH